MDKQVCQKSQKPPKQAQFPDARGRASVYASKLVKRLGQRFESARRLSKSADLQVKRRRQSERRDASRLRVLQPVLQPVWPKPSPRDVLEVSTTLTQSTHISLSESRCCGWRAHITGPFCSTSTLLRSGRRPLRFLWLHGSRYSMFESVHVLALSPCTGFCESARVCGSGRRAPLMGGPRPSWKPAWMAEGRFAIETRVAEAASFPVQSLLKAA